MKTILFSLVLCFNFCAINGQWELQDSHSDASLRAVEVIDSMHVYASGSEGTLLRTRNGGKNWEKLKIPNSSQLDFRGLAVLPKGNILLLSAGLGENAKAKLFRSNRRQNKWKLVYENKQKGVFLDAIDIANNNKAFIIGDAIDKKPFVLKSNNGGKKWRRLKPENFPDILPGEASFAASNSCIFALATGRVWFHTQNRVFRSENFGKTWQVSKNPLEKGESSGIFGLYFWSSFEGISVGGDYIKDTGKYINYSLSHDGGKSWEIGVIAPPKGLKEDATLLNNGLLILVGPSGTSIKGAFDSKFKAIDTLKLHAISSVGSHCWAVGPRGRICKWK